MLFISSSVGRQGRNENSDVKVVQQLINRVVLNADPLFVIDGVVTTKLIGAIELFQDGFNPAPRFPFVPSGSNFGMRTTTPSRLGSSISAPEEPKGTIYPGGRTFLSLCGGNAFREKIAWGQKVSADFKSKVIGLCDRLGIPVDFLMSAMAFESGETFSPAKKNAMGSGATGLIQFMPSIAKTLGTSTDDLSKMTAEKQLDYVGKYFQGKSGKLHSLEDVYMAILWPAAVGRDPDDVLFARGTASYRENAGLDSNNDGKVTLREAAAQVRAKFNKGVTLVYLG